MSVWNCSSSVEDAVERVLNHYGHATHISSISLRERDALGTAQCLKSRVDSDRFREADGQLSKLLVAAAITLHLF
jgi:hypothetical protein